MKRKTPFLTFIVIYGFTIFLFAANNSAAASSSTNTFDCKWNGTCRAEPPNLADCDNGYTVDNEFCRSITEKDDCVATTNQACVITEATGEKWWCDSTKTGIRTAIGCIPITGTDGKYDFTNFVLRWAIGVGGGVAFLLIVYSGFMIMTASGNPERMQSGKELLTSAISGLILLIFSIFILRFIGIDILGLGEFGFGT